MTVVVFFFFFSSRRRHTSWTGDWSSDVCSSDMGAGTSFKGFGLHPHSGIATVTHILQGSVRYEDTTGARGILPEGGVEWFKASHGAWHGGGPGESGRTRGFQLWLALPAEHELGAVESIYQAPDTLQRDGSAIVLLGDYGDAKSALR